jgi:hypothetical protein
MTLACVTAICLAWAGTAFAQASASPSPSPLATAFPTTIAQTRFTVDANNLTWALRSDSSTASVGAIDNFGDSIGSLVATAVLIKSPSNTAWNYRPTRVDVLFAAKAPQPSRPVGMSDFLLTLYSDDGSTDHNPGVQVRNAHRV